MSNDRFDSGRMWRLAVIERRLTQAEGFTYIVPGLALTAQAFLLTIVLGRDVSHVGRFVAALAGFVIAFTVAQVYTKQVYVFDLHLNFMLGEARLLGLPSVSIVDLKKEIPADPDLPYGERRWEEGWKKRLVADFRSVRLWLFTLWGFVALDAFLLVYSLVAMSGADPHWVSSPAALPTGHR